MMASDPFKTLNLPPTATPAEVKQRFRELSMAHHPDHGGDAGAFIELHEAYLRAYTIAKNQHVCLKCGGTGSYTIQSGFRSIQMRCSCKK